MAVTVERVPSGEGRATDVWGRHRVHLLRVTLDSSHLAAGEVLNLASFGVADPARAVVFCSQRDPQAGGYVFNYDNATDKLLAFWVDTTVDGAALAPVPDATDLSAVVVDLLVIEA